MAFYFSAPLSDPNEGLPPMPTMYGAELFCGDRETYAYMRGELPPQFGGIPLYTQEQMRTFARDAVRLALGVEETKNG